MCIQRRDEHSRAAQRPILLLAGKTAQHSMTHHGCVCVCTVSSPRIELTCRSPLCNSNHASLSLSLSLRVSVRLPVSVSLPLRVCLLLPLSRHALVTRLVPRAPLLLMTAAQQQQQQHGTTGTNKHNTLHVHDDCTEHGNVPPHRWIKHRTEVMHGSICAC